VITSLKKIWLWTSTDSNVMDIQEIIMLLSRIALLAFITLFVLGRPAWSSDLGNGVSSSSPGSSWPFTVHRDNHVLHGEVDQVQRGLQGSSSTDSLRIPRPGADLNNEQPSRGNMPGNSADLPVLNVNQPFGVKPPLNSKPPLLGVQDVHQTTSQGLGLLGMYALCADNARIPYYITNVFPPSELNQYGVESGDLLTRINGVSPFDYMHTGHPITPGATIVLTFEHQGISKTVSAKLQDMRTFTPFFESYSRWAIDHTSFLQEHQGQYHSCGLF
jgi:hypothetical protein